MRLHHVALWVRDLERTRAFYTSLLGATCGPRYESARTGMRSYFLSLEGGAQIELMAPPPSEGASAPSPRLGYAHVALTTGSRAAVDTTVARLRAAGVPVISEPRVTGDGYYEAVVADPDGNAIEIVA